MIIEFIFVSLNPIPKDHIVDLVPCISYSLDVLVLKDSHKTLLINFMENIFTPALSKLLFKV